MAVGGLQVPAVDARNQFQRHGLPIISVDTNKRELAGNFRNSGAHWDRLPALGNDHDFRSDSLGVAIPYGVYDRLANRGAVLVGVSHHTPCLAVHSIARWWRRAGADRCARARQLLILADNGGSHGCRCGAWPKSPAGASLMCAGKIAGNS